VSRSFREPDFQPARQALRHEAAQKVRELTQLIALLRTRKLHTVVRRAGLQDLHVEDGHCRESGPKIALIDSGLDLRYEPR
jgi:hypothetical protein